jgi:hypothetical protein
MPKKLTITVDAEVYDGLHSVIGRRRISRFLNDLARPHVVGQNLSAGYAAMAADGGEFENSLETEPARLPLAGRTRRRRLALLRRACRVDSGAAASLRRGACVACFYEDGRRAGRKARAAGRIPFGS